MKRMFVGSVVLLIASVPAWAHCGKCGVGEAKGDHGKAHAVAKVGKPAPDFALKDVDGSVHKLADLKGKVVVLEWINHECPVVNRCHDAKLMATTAAKFADKPVVWLAIDSSNFAEKKSAEIRAWNDKRKLSYPVLLDASGEVGHHYGAKTTPHMFVIDQKGVVAYIGAPDDNPYGDKENATNYVEAAVSSLLNGSTVAVASTKSYGCSVKYKK